MDAVQKAIFHYESEKNKSKEYAKPILDGLYVAKKKLEKYNKFVETILVDE